MKTDKKAFFIAASVIFIIASVFIVGWIIRDERMAKNGGSDEKSVLSQESADDGSGPADEITSQEDSAPIVVNSKKDAEKAANDMDQAMGSLGDDLSN